MSMLVILLPARPHLAAAVPGDGEAPPAAGWHWLLSPDGLAVSQQGHSASAPFPSADTVVAVLAAGDVGWHHPTLPKAPAARLRAALGGVLEEQLLDDDEAVHLALAPQATAGAPVWVAALHRPWLQAQLAALRAAGQTVDRVVPLLAPAADAGSASGHFYLPEAAQAEGEPAGAWLVVADGQGLLNLPLAGSLARSQQARWAEAGVAYTASPAAVAAAERWLGAPVAVRSEAEQALAAVRSPWNLLQFDLAPSRRGTRALGDVLRQLLSPAWAPVRWGVAALLLAQVLGLNLWAWHQQAELASRREAMNSLLRSAHPQVRAVLDAPLQMKRETDALRELAGVPGENDFEPLLAAAAAAWPDGQPPAAQLRFEPGRLSLAASGWTPPQVDQLRQRLQATGWALDNSDGRLTISRAARPAGA